VIGEKGKILITGGAGYIGSTLVAELLQSGYRVVVVDDLWFGGESIAPLMQFDRFSFYKRNVGEDDSISDLLDDVDCVVHLAAIVGYPACEKAGREFVWKINVEATKKVYNAANDAGIKRMIFASSYSNYGESKNGEMVTEESPLYPKSSYAESKIAAERFLLDQTDKTTSTVCLRLSTVFGFSPRTRFDLIINQFVLDAFVNGKLTLYQEDFKRSFVHVRDVVKAIHVIIEAPDNLIRNQVFNIGSERLNFSKKELLDLIKKQLPNLIVSFKEIAFNADMRSIHVAFDKARRVLDFEASIAIEDGIRELVEVLRLGLIPDPFNNKYRNHPPAVL
jgi:nucleoside-diphosphate-sugar epimerase